jgi:predicted NBD/HSP70 family sugar kinase
VEGVNISRSIKRVLSTADVRQFHQHAVIQELFHHPGSSQAQLMSRTGLSRPTISEIMDGLVRDGIVIRDTSERPRRGAPTGKYFLNPERLIFIGLDVTQEHVFALRIDVTGQELDRAQLDRHRMLRWDQDLSGFPLLDQAFESGAIAVPAMFNATTQVIERSTVFPELVESRLRERLMAATHSQFGYVHNAAAAALTERGPGPETSAVYLLVGTSVGVGYAGPEGPAGLGPHHGEIAHLPIDGRGPQCPVCGQRGCLESLAGLVAVARSLGIEPQAEATWTEPEVLAAVRDKLTRLEGRWPSSLWSALDALATATEIVTQVMGEIPIVIGGRTGDLLWPGVVERLEARALWIKPQVRAPMTAISERWRIAYGAALFARDQWLATFPKTDTALKETIINV